MARMRLLIKYSILDTTRLRIFLRLRKLWRHKMWIQIEAKIEYSVNEIIHSGLMKIYICIKIHDLFKRKSSYFFNVCAPYCVRSYFNATKFYNRHTAAKLLLRLPHCCNIWHSSNARKWWIKSKSLTRQMSYLKGWYSQKCKYKFT